MDLKTLLIGVLLLLAFVAAVITVLVLVVTAVRRSGRSASRGMGTGEGGSAFHAGTGVDWPYGRDGR
ncbi:hypothetical protein O4J56_12835 [Nocardiopsis sp. RSe5-2]|uniref:Uncharacterized protein n=1 Tax=Nocardiopsis endophytica TaxID=3018445 RepID=A0ABT4U4V4_9ACTN|nr:hypothetical protein [Nocardiopsis endophytica]MDA2811519.1 hypothetical protein [Nocardiopsis endophytica]